MSTDLPFKLTIQTNLITYSIGTGRWADPPWSQSGRLPNSKWPTL